MDLKNKKVLVIGTGISGMGAAKLLCSEGAIPIFYDENEKIKPEEVQGKMPEGVSGEVIIGSLPESIKDWNWATDMRRADWRRLQEPMERLPQLLWWGR